MNATGLVRKAGALPILLMGVSLATGATACPSPEALNTEAFNRAFTQEKFMAGMDHPLRSSGRLVAHDNEIVWHMLTPFDVKTTITPQGISQSIDGGASANVGTGASEISTSLARSLAAMMRGEWNSLKSIFAVTLPSEMGEGDWTVRLNPLDDRLKALLGSITVRGCQDVSTVDIKRPDGDHEHIQFDAAAS